MPNSYPLVSSLVILASMTTVGEFVRSIHPSHTSSIRRPSKQYTCKHGLIPLPSKADEHSKSISRSVVSFIDVYVLAINPFVQPIGAVSKAQSHCHK